MQSNWSQASKRSLGDWEGELLGTQWGKGLFALGTTMILVGCLACCCLVDTVVFISIVLYDAFCFISIRYS